MELLAFQFLKGLHQNPHNKDDFSRRKILETVNLTFWSCCTERRFHLLLRFLI
jgi:hypothetical protein